MFSSTFKRIVAGNQKSGLATTHDGCCTSYLAPSSSVCRPFISSHHRNDFLNSLSSDFFSVCWWSVWNNDHTAPKSCFLQFSRDFIKNCMIQVAGCSVYWQDELLLQFFTPLGGSELSPFTLPFCAPNIQRMCGSFWDQPQPISKCKR